MARVGSPAGAADVRGRREWIRRATLLFGGVVRDDRAAHHGRTKVILQGIADRDLVGIASTEAVRGVANEYARQMLDEIARRLEELATSEPAKAREGSSRLAVLDISNARRR